MSALPLRTLASARWDCGGCTACCRHFTLGPVSDDVVANLEEQGIRRAWAPAAQGFAVQRPGPGGEPAWFLTRRDDGACVFLDEGGGCAVHARLGAAAKPAFCREYPFTVVEEPTHTAVVIRADCGGWAESFDTGTPVADQVAAIHDLPRLHPPTRFTMDPVVILPGVGVGLDQWSGVEAALTPLLRDNTDPGDTIRSCAAALYTLVGRTVPDHDPARAAGATAFAVHQLRQALGTAVANPPGDDAESRGQVTFLAEVLDLLDRAAPGLAPAPLLAPPRTLDDSARAYVALVLRSELLGRSFQALGGIPAWLGVVGLGVRIATAAAPGHGPVSATALGRGLATWIRLTRHGAARRLLGDLRPVLVDLFHHSGG
jgi:Fe-S-cluster containining protein